MLSLSSGMCSASHGMSYYQKDNYYQQSGPGLWHGRGASVLKLSDSIAEKDFKNILHGYDSLGKKLVRNAGSEQRNAYFDCTFSAPKSATILSLQDKEIEAAHLRSVRKVLDIIERDYMLTRVGAQGVSKQRTSEMVSSLFTHHENRNLDPQLHTHCVIMNLTRDKKGKWLSIDNNEIFSNKMFFGQLYKNYFAHELQQLGYEIAVRNRAQGTFEISGVDQKVIDEFSTRRAEILDRVSDLKLSHGDKVSSALKKQMACLDSRTYKSKQSIAALQEDVQHRLKTHGATLDAVVAKAHAVAPSLRFSVSADECITHALRDITAHKSGFRREDVLLHALRMGVGQFTLEDVEKSFTTHPDLVALGTMDISIGKSCAPSVPIYSTHEIQAIEQGIVSYAEERIGCSSVVASESSIEHHFQALGEKGIVLTEGQRSAVERICMSRDGVNIIQGDAGSGKTFAVDHIRAVMAAHDVVVRGFAPTGKAAQELSTAHIETMTMDSALCKKPESLPFDRGELWVVDECSMVGSKKMDRFLRLADAYAAKVVFVGDIKQLQSIEQGKIFQDLQEHTSVTTVTMGESIRQQNAYMKSLVQSVKEKNISQAFSLVSAHEKLHEIADDSQRYRGITQEYCESVANGDACIVVTGSNAERLQLNGAIRAQLIADGHVHDGKTYSIQRSSGLSGSMRSLAENYTTRDNVFFEKDVAGISAGTRGVISHVDTDRNTITVRYVDYDHGVQRCEKTLDMLQYGMRIRSFQRERREFGIGDRVVFLKNDSRYGVKNGDFGRITALDDKRNAHIRLSDGREVDITISLVGDNPYPYVDHAYALTTYKSQGATVDKVVIAHDALAKRTNMNDLYVSVTRARHDVSVYTNDVAKMKLQSAHIQDKVSTLDSRISERVARLEDPTIGVSSVKKRLLPRKSIVPLIPAWAREEHAHEVACERKQAIDVPQKSQKLSFAELDQQLHAQALAELAQQRKVTESHTKDIADSLVSKECGLDKEQVVDHRVPIDKTIQKDRSFGLEL